MFVITENIMKHPVESCSWAIVTVLIFKAVHMTGL